MTSKFKVNMFKYAGVNYDAGTMIFPGNITVGSLNANAFSGTVIVDPPTVALIDIVGNVVGNSILSGNITATELFIGNGALLTGILKPFITTDVDIRGNVTGEYANVSNIIATDGNIAGVRFENGNVHVPGELFTSLLSGNVDGGYANVSNIIASIGNVAGVLLENGNVTVPGVFNTSLISSNVVGGYANVSDIIATVGNIAGVRFENGNVSVPGDFPTSLLSGNVIGGYANVSNITAAVGNIAGVLLESGNVTVPGTFPTSLLSGNITGGYANVSDIIATVGNVAGVRFESGNVSVQDALTGGMFVGNITGEYANVSNIISTVGNVANVRFDNGNLSVPGDVTASLIMGNVSAQVGNVAGVLFENGNVSVPGALIMSPISGNVVGGYANVSNIISTVGNVANVIFEHGNVHTPGTISAGSFSGNIVAASGNIANVHFENGDMSTPGNVIASNFNGNVIATYGNIANVIFSNENISLTGGITTGYFVGDGSQMTEVPIDFKGSKQSVDIIGNVIGSYANIVNVIATLGNVANVHFENGNMSASGNIAAGFFVGNGAGVVNYPLPNLQGTIQTVDVIGNITGTYANVANVFVYDAIVNGNVSATYLLGNAYYMALNGLTVKPIPSVANVQQRLELTNIQDGTYVRERDVDIPYVLVRQPPSQGNNWIRFVSLGAVNAVFGRVGFIDARPRDYSDSQIRLSSNVGPFVANVGLVSNALGYLNTTKATVVGGNISAEYFLGNIISTGNVTARLFVGNGANLTNLGFGIGGTAQPIDIRGNATGGFANVANILAITGNIANVLFSNGNISTPGNVSIGLFVGNASQVFDLPIGNIQGTIQPMSIAGNVIGSYANVSNIISTFGNIAGVPIINGNISTSGNVSAGLFVGNGAGLTDIPIQGTVQSVDIRGNVIGSYANVSNIIASGGNIAGVIIINGNISTPGNVSAGIFTGNATGVTGIPGLLSGSPLNVDIRGNAIGAYANVSNIIASGGNIAGVRFANGNISTSGNVSAGIFVGNGAGLTDIPIAGTVQSIDILGNVIGAYANVANIIAGAGNVGTVLIENGNVIVPESVYTGIFSGNLIGEYANVSNVIAVAGNIGTVLIENGNVSAPGTMSSRIFAGNLIGEYANVSNIIAIAGNIGNVRMLGGNVITPGTVSAGIFAGNLIGAYANVSNIIAVAGNVGNVRMVGGNVTAAYFIGNGALLTHTSPPLFTTVTGSADSLTSTSVRNRVYTGSGTSVTLPSATTLATGATYLINSGQPNTPGNFTTVADSTGGLLYRVCSKASCLFTLTSNSSAAGTWVPIASGEKNCSILYGGRPVTTVGSGTVLLRYPTLSYDNLNQYDTSTGVFTASTDGYYTITASIAFTSMSVNYFTFMRVTLSTGQTFIVNGNQVSTGYSSVYLVNGTVSVYLPAGGTATVFYGQAGTATHTTYNDTEWNYLSIAKHNI